MGNDFIFGEEIETNQLEDLQDNLDSLFFEWSKRSGYKRIKFLRVRQSGGDNRFIITRSDNTTYSMTQDEITAYTNPDHLSHVIKTKMAANDIWLHKNRDGVTWAIAIGASPPAVWPEDDPIG
jgi:hypothetical protein